MSLPPEIDVTTAAAKLQTGALLLDVREPAEVAHVCIPGARQIPMREIPAALADLPPDREILVLCHHGGRSARVTQFLRAQGLTLVTNVAGGIDAWATQVDPSLPRY